MSRTATRLSSRLFAAAVVAIVVGSLMASRTSAATIKYILEPDFSGVDQFTLSAQVSVGDNAGLAFYSIPLKGTVLTLDHRAPYAISAANFAPAGFSLLRSPDITVPTVDPVIRASQDSVAGPQANLIYGMGQEPSSFFAKGIPVVGIPDITSDQVWTNPIVLAKGTYDRSAGVIGFDASSADLDGEVYYAAGSRETSLATIQAPFNAACCMPHIVPVEVDAHPGAIVTQQLTADHFPSTWSALTPISGSPAIAATLSPEGQLQWNSAGSPALPNGIEYSWRATATNFVGLERSLAITVRLIPEPTGWALVLLGFIGLFARTWRIYRSRTFRQQNHLRRSVTIGR